MSRRWWAAWALATPLLIAAPAAAETRALVVAGLGGTADFESEFQRYAKATSDALRRVTGDVTLLLGEMVTSERVGSELGAVAARSAPRDALLLVLIGHGSYDERDYRFNVPGIDFTGAELAAWLDSVPSRQQLVVAATSSSGALQEVLARDGRVVVTATRSGGERNAGVFARFFTEALQTPAADTDKDGFVAAAEAFRYAEAQVAGYYQERREMATEHPTLGGAEPGLRLARLQDAGRSDVAGVAPGRLEELEAAIDELRAAKDAMAPDAYYGELQRLLLELAMARRNVSGEMP